MPQSAMGSIRSVEGKGKLYDTGRCEYTAFAASRTDAAGAELVRLPPPSRPWTDSVGKVRAGPLAKAQRRKGPGRRWCLPTESGR
jgi:hypothetical protein